MQVGVLAIQGDAREHALAIQSLGAKAVEVRKPQDLKECSGLIIPGGESTTLSLLMKKHSLDKEIKNLAKKGFPIFGTCAGAILLAKEADRKKGFLGLMDLEVERNAYGRQVDSFEADLLIAGKKLHAVFVRAPIIKKAGPNVRILAKFNGNPVLVEQGPMIAATFHPELAGEMNIHRLFLEKAHNFASKHSKH